MPLNAPDINELRAILDWVNLTEGVRELSIKIGDVELFVSRNQQSAAGGAAPAPVLSAPSPSAPAEAAPAPVAAEPATPAVPAAPAAAATSTAAPGEGLAPNEVLVKAPMVGIFYEAPKPGAPAFVEEGGHVEAGNVLCIVEVMKLMNNIEAPVAGTVKRVFVANNDAVAYGQPLMVIERDA